LIAWATNLEIIEPTEHLTYKYSRIERLKTNNIKIKNYIT
jgi:hypothetical protein